MNTTFNQNQQFFFILCYVKSICSLPKSLVIFNPQLCPDIFNLGIPLVYFWNFHGYITSYSKDLIKIYVWNQLLEFRRNYCMNFAKIYIKDIFRNHSTISQINLIISSRIHTAITLRLSTKIPPYISAGIVPYLEQSHLA